ncbi:hypothetical protein BHM03_00056205 [Ensete ventricosum]|nr:hypothetical protein BHM03_00056205 [Ensete ventricosum]
MTSTLTGFTGDEITPVGVVTLPMTSDNEPRTKTLIVPFMMVELPSAYNVSIGRPTLNKLRAVVCTYHCSMKFPTSNGAGEIRNDPRDSNDAVGSRRKFARRFTEGIGKLAGNTKGNRREKDQRTCHKNAGGCWIMRELGLN